VEAQTIAALREHSRIEGDALAREPREYPHGNRRARNGLR